MYLLYNSHTKDMFFMENINKKDLVKKLTWIKLGSKLLILVGIILFVLSLVNMFLHSVIKAKPFLITSNILLIIAIIIYLASKVLLHIIYYRYNEEFDVKETKKLKVNACIKLGVTIVLISTLGITISAVKPTLGDMGNIIDMVGYSALSYANPVKGKAKANDLLEKTGGFMEGICHVKTLEQAKVATNANITWNREDIGGSYTYDAKTKIATPSQGFIDRFSSWKQIHDETGMKYFCVTPYPEDYSYMQIVNSTSSQQVILKGLSNEECTDTKRCSR